MKILHVLYTSVPDVTGSSIRSEGIIRAQSEAGMQPTVVSSPFQKPNQNGSSKEIISGVHYYRTFNGVESQLASERSKSVITRFSKAAQIVKFVRKVRSLGEKLEADVVHCHSTFFCGLAGYYVSKRSGIPFVYEVRSLWEERAKKSGILDQFLMRAIRHLETFVMKKADALVTINEGLKENIMRRGIDSACITIVPNCVTDQILQSNSNGVWSGLKRDKLRFAYIGNVSDIEGLEMLVEAFSEVFEAHPGSLHKLAIYGDGAHLSKLKEFCKDEFSHVVDFKGRFHRHQVSEVYNSVDCVVIPRRDLLINQTVTPLKPLEAMAFKKLVIISDVKGLTEVVGEKDNVLMFKADDVRSLSSLIASAINQEREQLNLRAESGYRYVKNERAWSSTSDIYRPLYETLLKRRTLE